MKTRTEIIGGKKFIFRESDVEGQCHVIREESCESPDEAIAVLRKSVGEYIEMVIDREYLKNGMLTGRAEYLDEQFLKMQDDYNRLSDLDFKAYFGHRKYEITPMPLEA